MPPLIAVEHVSFRYPGESANRPALDGVDFEINAGEFVAVIGANGSGKTTLARHLNGLLLPDQGRVLVDGMDTRQRSLHGRICQRVGMVFQHPEDQIVATTVEEDVAFGPENLGLEPQRIRKRVDEAIAALGLEAHRNRPPHLLSVGQMQRLALAGVLAMRPRCVVFDEATTMLDPAGRRMALELMADLRAEGLSVVFVTHNMEEAALATRVIVIHAGKIAFDGPPAHVFANARLADWGLEPPPAVRLADVLGNCVAGLDFSGITMEDFLTALPRWDGTVFSPRPADRSSLAPAVIEVRGLEHIYLRGTPLAHPALQSINFSVPGGRAHGLAGVTGSGKSTVLQHLNGLLRPQKGTVRVGDLQLHDLRLPTRAVVKEIGLVFQNPEMQFFESYVGDEIAYGPRQLALGGSLRERVRLTMEMMGLDFEAFKDRLVNTLSGGEKRKVALASVLVNQTRFLLLDEPTAGLDPRSHRDILGCLRRLQTEGKQMVISSHRMDDLAELAQDLTVFRKGASLFSGPAGDFFEREKELIDAGLEQPTATRTAEQLRRLGWPIPAGIVTASQLAQAVRGCQEAAG